MNWRAAFLRQAASDEAVRRLLDRSGVERCHGLHYLQMVAEKLAKGLLATANDPRPPATTHQAFVRLLQMAKNRPDVRQRLGYHDTASFLALVNSLLPLAAKIEALAPSAAGMGRPNPEYPWRDPATFAATAPADHEFVDFDPRSPQMRKLASLMEQLARLPRCPRLGSRAAASASPRRARASRTTWPPSTASRSTCASPTSARTTWR